MGLCTLLLGLRIWVKMQVQMMARSENMREKRRKMIYLNEKNENERQIKVTSY